MLVTGSLYADLFARIGAPAPRQDAGNQPASAAAQPAPPTRGNAPADDARPDQRTPHFSMISTVSPGSLAAAYHVMRAGDGGADPAAAPAQDRAILSGLGIPSALDAYGEVLDSD